MGMYMPEWLTDLFQTPPVAIEILALRVALALVFGFVVAAIYRGMHSRANPGDANLAAMLVILTVLISMVTQVVGDSTARAFSLVGALSIVRFRTVVEDTRDTAFVIFAVVVGMATGTGLPYVALVGMGFVALAVLLLKLLHRRPTPAIPAYRLVIRLGVGHDAATLDEVFARFLTSWDLVSLATARQGAAVDLGYAARFRDPAQAPALVAELNRREGVQGVEMQRS